ncbi:DUF3099 domain-containing protein, partial [Streptomyces sp. NPDC127177]|uniref:DUF3099 domain-containing protein n=1 Tax=Streptomyces sp. NPDC127177 TaxID=3345384 RepID=UPI003636C56B
ARLGLGVVARCWKRRSVISLSVRSLSVVAAAALWNVERYVAIVGLALGVLLPYIAVVIANAGRENTPSLPSTFVSAPTRPALGSAPAGSPPDPGPQADQAFRSPGPQGHG